MIAMLLIASPPVVLVIMAWGIDRFSPAPAPETQERLSTRREDEPASRMLARSLLSKQAIQALDRRREDFQTEGAEESVSRALALYAAKRESRDQGFLFSPRDGFTSRVGVGDRAETSQRSN